MILNNKQIIEACNRGDILINPFDENQVQPATYDLRVGDQGATTTTKKLVNIRDAGFITIQPGDFGVITVLEEIRLADQYVGRFGLRSKYARKGLIATTGPQIDPGYHGKLIIGLTNLTPRPIALTHRGNLLSVEFHRHNQPSTKLYGRPYQNKMELSPEETEFITESESMALSEVITTLRSLSANVSQMSREIKDLKWMIPIILGVGMAILGIMIHFK